MKNLSDKDLIIAYQKSNDKNIIGILFERYTLLVFGVCMKYLQDEENAKDALMQVFENLIILLKKHDIDNFKSWLHSVVKNHCLMELRKSNKFPIYKGDISEISTPHMEFYQIQHLSAETNNESVLKMLEMGLNKLNDDQKTCIDMFYLQQKSYQEVCNITGYNMNQVKSHIQNGKRNLKLFLDGKINE